MDQKPDAPEFVRQLLHSNAALAAEVKELKYLLCDVLADLKRVPAEQFRNHYDAATKEMAGRMYDDACREVKIPPPDN